nr:MAG TPA: hypothetical protein [Caudoviricetes sp.]
MARIALSISWDSAIFVPLFCYLSLRFNHKMV